MSESHGAGAAASRYIKIGADGLRADVNVANHVAVVDRVAQPNGMHLVWAVAVIGNEPLRRASDDPPSWSQADSSAKACRLLGRDGWRLPTLKELYPLLECVENHWDAEGGIFPGALPASYWTSTRAITPEGDESVWRVRFGGGGSAGIIRKKACGFARAVSTMSAAECLALDPSMTDEYFGKVDPTAEAPGRFTKIGANGARAAAAAADHVAVLDSVAQLNGTHLMWAVAVSSNASSLVMPTKRLNWHRARASATESRLLGYANWRLPSASEMLSIIDLSRALPAIDMSLFPGTSAGEYWTDTDAVFSATQSVLMAARMRPELAADFAQQFLLDSGGMALARKDATGLARAVRTVTAEEFAALGVSP